MLKDLLYDRILLYKGNKKQSLGINVSDYRPPTKGWAIHIVRGGFLCLTNVCQVLLLIWKKLHQ